MEDGDVLFYGGGIRGLGSSNSKVLPHTKVTGEMLKGIAKLVDEQHSKGKAIVARDIVAYLLENCYLRIHQTTAGRTLKGMGITWSPIKKAKRSYASYRIASIRDFLIKLDLYERDMQEGNGVYIKVFTDESYVNTNHASKNSYLPTDDNLEVKISRKDGKGRRLIILHAITEDGPLCDIDPVTGKYVDDLKRTGDIHVIQKRGQIVC